MKPKPKRFPRKVTKEEAYARIAELVERFGEHLESYKRSRYNEHQTRIMNAPLMGPEEHPK